MCFNDWATASGDERSDRFSASYWSAWHPSDMRGRRVNICALCLDADEKPYLRRDWFLGWLDVCPVHRVRMQYYCSKCHSILRAPRLNAETALDATRCGKCQSRVWKPLKAAMTQAAHPAAMEMQAALMAVKRAGRGHVPGLGLLTWTATMTFADGLLGEVWKHGKGRNYEPFLRLVRHDLELDHGDAGVVHWHRNYGGLMILSWLFSDLTERTSLMRQILDENTEK